MYLNREDVQLAIHVSEEWMKNNDTKWEICNDPMNEEWTPKYNDTFDLFEDIIVRVQKLTLKRKLSKNFRILSFNGDV
jgi:hypothetical protein